MNFKKPFLILSTILLLASCEVEISSFVSSVEESTVSSTSNESSSTAESQISSTSITTSSSTEEVTLPDHDTFKMEFRDNPQIGTGEVSDSKWNAKFNTSIKALYPCVDKVEATKYVQMMSLGKNGEKVLTIGSSSYSGSITFTFLKDITSFKINAQAYSKYVEYNSMTLVDTDVKLYINDDNREEDIPSTANTLSSPIDIDVNYTSPSKTLTLYTKSSNKRVFINSITVTY